MEAYAAQIRAERREGVAASPPAEVVVDDPDAADAEPTPEMGEPGGGVGLEPVEDDRVDEEAARAIALLRGRRSVGPGSIRPCSEEGAPLGLAGSPAAASPTDYASTLVNLDPSGTSARCTFMVRGGASARDSRELLPLGIRLLSSEPPDAADAGVVTLKGAREPRLDKLQGWQLVEVQGQPIAGQSFAEIVQNMHFTRPLNLSFVRMGGTGAAHEEAEEEDTRDCKAKIIDLAMEYKGKLLLMPLRWKIIYIVVLVLWAPLAYTVLAIVPGSMMLFLVFWTAFVLKKVGVEEVDDGQAGMGQVAAAGMAEEQLADSQTEAATTTANPSHATELPSSVV